MAHMAEHAGFKYRAQIEQQMGISLPPQDAQLPPQVEMALSTMMAQAAQQVLQQSQGQAAQAQAQQQAQDPIVQMQMQELQIKQGELQLKNEESQQKFQIEQARLKLDSQRLAADAANKVDQTNLKRETIQAEMQLEGTKIGSKIKADQERQTFDQEHAGLQLGAQISKEKRDQALSALQTVDKSTQSEP
jgi:hypothetical protein